MKTVALLSQKGGAGKTTLALHLACAAKASGLASAIIDLDPQASAAAWHDSRADEEPVVVALHAPGARSRYRSGWQLPSATSFARTGNPPSRRPKKGLELPLMHGKRCISLALGAPQNPFFSGV